MVEGNVELIRDEIYDWGLYAAFAGKFKSFVFSLLRDNTHAIYYMDYPLLHYRRHIIFDNFL
jgi:hypothetical protein